VLRVLVNFSIGNIFELSTRGVAFITSAATLIAYGQSDTDIAIGQLMAACNIIVRAFS
jgi:hypothetical protein